MWRICVILAMWSYQLNAQFICNNENNQVRGAGGGGRRETNSVQKIIHDYRNHNPNVSLPAANNTIVNLTKKRNRKYNQNSRDSFGYADTLPDDQLLSREKESPQMSEIANTENSLSATTVVSNAYFTTSEPSAAWKIQPGDSFEARLFDTMCKIAQQENLVYSPISLEMLLAFIFTVSDGRLHEELAQLLAISNSRLYVAQVFENILHKSAIDSQTTTLIMANKLYYDYRFGPIDPDVRNTAKISFDSELEQLNFFESKNAANSINSWVRNKTRNLIKEIVTPSSISGDSSALLLNSIYFKGEWLTKFVPGDTEKQEFFLSQRRKVPVDMMYNEDVFRYGDFSEDLHASVVELPYKTSNLSMLLILPLDIEGLSHLESKLRYHDFNTISQRLKREIVTVRLPKFQIEYELNMIAALQEMGLNALFNNAGIINLFKNPQKHLKIDQFKHKSFINLNEAGTEAAATTVAKYVPLSLPTDMKYFVADHPFVFAIRDANTTFFMGHVVKF